MKKILLIAMLLTIYIQADGITAEKCFNSTNTAMKMFEDKKMTKEQLHNNLLKPLCDMGCGKACTKLGGPLGTKETKEKGCNSKLPHGWACYDLSYDEKDEKKKLELQKKGCEAGYTMGCDFLAGSFAREKNYGLALKYYNIGCDLGDDQSCGQLGMIYARGDYGEASPQMAYEYWSKSVKLNPNNVAKGNLEMLCKNHPSICK